MMPEENQALEQEIRMELENSEELKLYAGRIKSLNEDELREELTKLDEELLDEEDEMKRMISQTGVHVYGSQIEAYRESFQREMARIKEKQRLINEALAG